MKMTHPLACVALAAALLAAVPALAQAPGTTTGMNCSEANMKTANDSMMKMTDATKKAAVVKEMDMAKDMMAKKDEKGCAMQMDKAMGK
jgi:pectate lyase